MVVYNYIILSKDAEVEILGCEKYLQQNDIAMEKITRNEVKHDQYMSNENERAVSKKSGLRYLCMLS